jgi:hypothetical protein
MTVSLVVNRVILSEAAAAKSKDLMLDHWLAVHQLNTEH